METKKVVLRAVEKTAKKMVEGACGSKSAIYFYEPEMPRVLKEKKMNK